MAVYLDVESRLNRRALEATASELRTVFNRLGAELSGNLGSAMSKALGTFDGRATRAELARLESAWTRAADVEADAARRMAASARSVEVAQARAAEMTERYTATHSKAMAASAALADTQARAARDSLAYTDAVAANEAAHQAHTQAMRQSAGATALAARAFNAAGIGSVAVFTGAVLESTKAAGNFEQSQQRLVASAGESAQNLKAVSDGILNLAGQVGYSSQELSKGMYDVEKAGYRGRDGVDVLRAAAQGAKSENAELGHVLNGLTSNMNDFNFGSNQAGEVMSKLVTASGLAKTSFQEFTGSVHSAEPILANIGKSQGLSTDQMHHLSADLLGLGAQMTQTGMSAENSFQLIGHAAGKMLAPTAAMRSLMGSLGLDSQELASHLGERGLTGTLQVMEHALQDHMKNGQLSIDAHYQSAQASRAEAEAYGALAPAAREVADEVKNGSLSYKEWRKAKGGVSKELTAELDNWDKLNTKLTGFNDLIKTGVGDHIDYDTALKILTGDQETLKVALQATGENQDKVNDKIRQVADTTAEADGTVKGFTETQKTLNAQIADAKAAWNAASIELGTVFVPYVRDAAQAAKWVGDELQRHPGIAQDVAAAVGFMGGAWLLFKGYNLASTVLTPIVGGLGKVIEKLGGVELQAGNAGTAMRNMGGAAAEGAAGVEAAAAKEVLAEQGVRDAALEADGAMAAGGAGGVGGGGKFGRFRSGARAFAGSLPIVGPTALALNDVSTSINPDNDASTWPDKGWVHTLFGSAGDWIAGRAGGGPLHAPGPKGHDSAIFAGADGEHVIPHHEVQRAGGHAGIYAIRRNIMNGGLILSRAGGGPIGPDVQAAESLAGTAYSQAARNDCSGMVGRVVNAVTGGGGGLPTTRNMGEWLAARGFVPGIGPAGTISVGWYNHGSGANDGHAAMTLSDGENAESGGSHGSFLVGGSVGASSSQFDRHMYLPELYGEGAGSGGLGGGYGGYGGGYGGLGGFGGGVPAGSTAGRGPGGQPGYYTPNPERVASAQEQLRHIDEEIRIAEERKANLKATASQAEKDRLDEEIRHLKAERGREEERLHKAEQGTFHAQRGGRGGSDPFLPVPLADKFGLDKGLPGLAEWAVGFLEDLVLGPLETGAMAAMQNSMFGGLAAPGPGMPGGLPDATPGAEGAGPKTMEPGSGGSAGGAGSGGTSGDQSTPVDLNGPLAADQISQLPIGQQRQLLRQAFTAPPVADYNKWYPKAATTDADSLPPDVLAFAQQHRLLGPDGNYSGPMPFGPQRSVTPPIKMQPDMSRLVQHHAKGGPSGTDTIPSWLSPGEEVEQKSAVDKYGAQFFEDLNQGLFDPSIVQYHDDGNNTGGTPPQPAPALPPPGPQNLAPQNPGTPKPLGPPQPGSGLHIPELGVKALAPNGPGQNGTPGEPGSAPVGATQSGSGVDVHPDQSNQATPGAGDQRPGAGLPPSPGLGISGGLIGGAEGAAEGAASAAGNAFAPGSGAAISSVMNVGFQELNRAASAGAQAAGVGVEGLLETVIPDQSGTGGDWMKTIPGRLLSGVAGVRPAGQNTAGQTQAPVPGGGQAAQYSGMGQDEVPGGMHLHGPVTVNADNAQQFWDSMEQQNRMSAAMYQNSGLGGVMGGGR